MTTTRTRCACPAQARAILDYLEAKVVSLDGDGTAATGLSDDRLGDVPGCGEPPD